MKKLNLALMASVLMLMLVAVTSLDVTALAIGGGQALPATPTMVCKAPATTVTAVSEETLLEAVPLHPLVSFVSTADSPCKQACSCDTQTAGEGCVGCMKRSMSDAAARAFCDGWCAVNREQVCGWNAGDVDACQDAVAAA
ncbi:MAG: hypothetical protein ABH864_07300 [archaeon]